MATRQPKKYFREWRKRNPHYSRDWMRRNRGTKALGVAWKRGHKHILRCAVKPDWMPVPVVN
jgi:hypothetical protein